MELNEKTLCETIIMGHSLYILEMHYLNDWVSRLEGLKKKHEETGVNIDDLVKMYYKEIKDTLANRNSLGVLPASMACEKLIFEHKWGRVEKVAKECMKYKDGYIAKHKVTDVEAITEENLKEFLKAIRKTGYIVSYTKHPAFNKDELMIDEQGNVIEANPYIM